MNATHDTALDVLATSAALWNRAQLDLNSQETLAQVLDRGSVADWRTLYAIARKDDALRDRVAALVETVPVASAWFWRAALASLGVQVDYGRPVPDEWST